MTKPADSFLLPLHEPAGNFSIPILRKFRSPSDGKPLGKTDCEACGYFPAVSRCIRCKRPLCRDCIATHFCPEDPRFLASKEFHRKRDSHLPVGAQLRRFLDMNPGESFTSEQISVLYKIERKVAGRTLRDLARDGKIRRIDVGVYGSLQNKDGYIVRF